MNKVLLGLSFCMLLLVPLMAQQTPEDSAGQSNDNTSAFSKEMLFIQHCFRRGNFDEVLFLLHAQTEHTKAAASASDTLNYWFGWTFYNQKQLDSSSYYLMKVSPNSAYYLKSRYFSSYNSIFNRQWERAVSILSETKVPAMMEDSMGALCQELTALQRGGMYLLRRDFPGFDAEKQHFTYQYYALSEEEKRMESVADRLQHYRPKSMLSAALMSAIVPGSGKIYARKTGEGIAAFLVVSALGMVTWENYRKDGITDVKTLFFGSLFSAYYIGNIWGSAYAAVRFNRAFHESMDQRILFDLHIPLRNIFN